MAKMHIVAFGAGGVGGYFGTKLALSGVDVTFVARGAHLDVIRTKGLTVRSTEGDMLVNPATATDDVTTIAIPDYLFFAVKLFDTEAVAEACLPIVGPNTTVVSMQNGVEAIDILNNVFGYKRVMGGTVGVATVISEPGVITQTGTFNFITIGEQDGTCSARGEALVAACNTAGTSATLSENINVEIWMKFVMLSALSNLTCVTRLPIGRLRVTPETRTMLHACVVEAVAVGRAYSVPLPDDAAQQCFKRLDGLPNSMVASMLHDLNAGKPLELERLGGATVRLGAAANIPTPTQAFCYNTLKPHIGGR